MLHHFCPLFELFGDPIEQELNITPKIAEFKKILEMDSMLGKQGKE